MGKIIAFIILGVIAIGMFAVSWVLSLICLAGTLIFLLFTAVISSAGDAASFVIGKKSEQAIRKQLDMVASRDIQWKSYMNKNDMLINYLKEKICLEEYEILHQAVRDDSLHEWSISDSIDEEEDFASFLNFFFENKAAITDNTFDLFTKVVANEVITILLLGLESFAQEFCDISDDDDSDDSVNFTFCYHRLNDNELQSILNLLRLMAYYALFNINSSECLKDSLITLKERYTTTGTLDQESILKDTYRYARATMLKTTKQTVFGYIQQLSQQDFPQSPTEQIRIASSYIKRGAQKTFSRDVSNFYTIILERIAAKTVSLQLSHNHYA